ncbi:MAG: insulinase family protein, partial [Pseudomonadota bacterium]
DRPRPDRGWQAVAPLTETQLLTHSDPKVRQPEYDRYYIGTSFRTDEDLAYALQVGLDVLGGGPTSQLYQALVEDQKIALSASAWSWSTLHDAGPAGFSATPAQGVSLDELEAALMAEVEAALAEGFPEEAVIRSRNSLAANAIYARDSQTGMANLYGRVLATGGTIEEVLEYEDRIRSVTPEQAIDALRTVFAEDKHYVEAHLLPEEETGE